MTDADLTTTEPVGSRGSQDLSGQRVIICGAGSGIGRATAYELASRGCRVACLDIDVDAVTEVATDAQLGGRAHAIRLDVTDADSVREACAAATDALGGVDALVNCVGITGQTNVKSHQVPIEDFDRVVAINLRGALLLSQAVLPDMVAQGYGRILHVASIAGKEGNAGMVSYSASKAGLIGMVKAQGKEYATTGVTVNALAPAVIHTPLVEAMPREQVRYMTDKIPMNRLGTLHEAATLIAFAISPATSFVTGFTWDLSGGRATY